MKYVLFLVVVFGGYYWYLNNSEQHFEVHNSKSLFEKLKTSPVRSTEIIKGASYFALQLCDDSGYQITGGHTTDSCRDKFHSFKEMCAERIFNNKEKLYSNKAEVAPLFKRFINCVGT